MSYLITELQDHPSAILMKGKSLQIHCCAHIINLIVTKGLEDLHNSISNIRNVVRYVRSSLTRLKRFKECVLEEKIATKSYLALDVSTR